MEIGRAIGLAQQSELLDQFGAVPTPVVLLTIDLLWAIAFVALFRCLRRPLSRLARWATLLLLVGHLATEAARLTILAPALSPAWPARILPLGFFVLFAGWAMFRPAHAAYWLAAAD